jgi:hypothetical protein
MVRSCFGDPCRTQPAHMQGILEKAAEGIRTLDLLHGKQTL